MPSTAYKTQKAAATQAALAARTEYRKTVLAAREANQRALAAAESDEERQVALRRIYRSERAWRKEVKYQVCIMELEGLSASEIAAGLGMTPGAVGNILSKAHRQRTEQIGEVIDLHRAMLLRHSETIIERFMPIALDADLFGRIERGEPVEAKRLDRAMRSAFVMLAVMDFRCRLLGLYPGTIRGPRGKGRNTQSK
jgi:predicted transcriptional regulator